MSIFAKQVEYKPFTYNDITEPFIEAIWANPWNHNRFNFKSDIQELLLWEKVC